MMVILIAVYSKSNEEIINYCNLEKKYCHAFVIPDEKTFEVPNVVFDILQSTANETGCNIIRAFFKAGNKKGEYILNKYIMFGRNSSSYLEECELKSGRKLIFEDTASIDSTVFLSTMRYNNNNQIGHLKNYMIGIDLELFPLGKVYDNYKPDGLYYVELGQDITYESFISVLAENIEEYSGMKLKNDKFEITPPDNQVPYVDITLLLVLFVVVLLLWTIAVLYYLIKRIKDISVMKMMGINKCGILIKLFLEPLSFSVIGLMVISFIAWMLNVGDYTCSIAVRCIETCVIMTFFCIISFSMFYRNIDISYTLKGKKGIKYLLLLQLFAELFFTLVYFSAGSSICNSLQTINQKIQIYKNWDIAVNYGVFCPVLIGNELTSEEESERDVIIGGKFYSEINKRGALYIDARIYEDASIQLNGEPDFGDYIYINPNYLNKFPWYDRDGNIITVSEDEEAAILIVPESLKQFENDIIANCLVVLEGDFEYEKAYIVEPMPVPAIKIIWARNNQKLFTFNSDVSKEAMGITDPIIFVITENNSYITARVGGYGNGYGDPRKIPIISSSKETYESLRSILEEYGLEDNFTRLISINNLNTEELAKLKLSFGIAVLEAIISVLIILVIVSQSTALIFDLNKMDYCIKRLYGISNTKIYGNYILIKIGIIAFLTCVYGLSDKKNGLLLIVVLSATMIVIQTLTIILFMEIQHQKRQIEVLKGQ